MFVLRTLFWIQHVVQSTGKPHLYRQRYSICYPRQFQYRITFYERDIFLFTLLRRQHGIQSTGRSHPYRQRNSFWYPRQNFSPWRHGTISRRTPGLYWRLDVARRQREDNSGTVWLYCLRAEQSVANSASQQVQHLASSSRDVLSEVF